MMTRRQFIPVEFAAGDDGAWHVRKIVPLRGDSLPPVARLDRVEGGRSPSDAPAWVLRGATSHIRYAEQEELAELASTQAVVGRAEADRAVLIPIRKSPEWWALAQDERRAIIEERSRHISIGKQYVASIARRLYHCQEQEAPFDFLTWFEFAARDAGVFGELVARLRATEEWRYVDREVEIHLGRTPD